MLQLQNNVHLNNPPLSLTHKHTYTHLHSHSLSPLQLAALSLAAADRDGKITLNLSTKSLKLEDCHTLPRASLYLGRRRRAPRGDGRVWRSFSGGFRGCRTPLWAAVKKRQGRQAHTFGSVHPLSWAPLGDWFASAPFLPFLPMRALPPPCSFTVLLCAESPPPPPLPSHSSIILSNLTAGGEAKLRWLQTCVMFLPDFIGFLKKTINNKTSLIKHKFI